MANTRSKEKPAVKKSQVTQGLLSVTHCIDAFVEITYGEGEVVDGKFRADNDTVRVKRFTGAAYRSIFEDGPAWAPGKPAGVYRDGDLFDLLDYCETNPDAFAEKTPAQKVLEGDVE